MKLNANLKIVMVVTFLLLLLSISISLINFTVSLNAKQTELKTRSLPLSVENIYTEIQRNIIEPNLISSMMAHDTFVIDWLINEENNHAKIKHYLSSIQQKYGMFVTFLVSEATQNYYAQQGLVERLSPNDPDNQWYFRFKNQPQNHEINLDYNDQLSNSMIMFINHKIRDKHERLIGATGIGMQMSYIDGILKEFREKYQFTVFFVNREGKVILRERETNPLTHLSDSIGLSRLSHHIFEHPKGVLEYVEKGERYLLNTQYVPELASYLLVQAKLDDFTQEVRQTFYVNLAVSLAITTLIILVILSTVRRYNQKLEWMARTDTTTGLWNRRAFNEAFSKHLSLSKRNHQPLSLIFFDVDDFKHINDQLGHQVGDKVLQRLGEILQTRFRETDLLARWGGEEFIVGLIDTSPADAETLAESLRQSIEEDDLLNALTLQAVTISSGVTACDDTDTPDTVFHRLDEAMYRAKDMGKNQTFRV